VCQNGEKRPEGNLEPRQLGRTFIGDGPGAYRHGTPRTTDRRDDPDAEPRGWSVGDTAFDYPTGRVWVVSGTNGENRIVAEGKTEREAWERARAVGWLGARLSWT